MNLPRKGSFMALTVEKGHNNLKLRTDLLQSVPFVEIKFLMNYFFTVIIHYFFILTIIYLLRAPVNYNKPKIYLTYYSQ